MNSRNESIIFRDRLEAGKMLGKILSLFKKYDPIVMAIPRGGIAIGFEVSKMLEVPLDIVLVKKVTAPGNPEFAIGVLTEENILVFDEKTLKLLHIPQEQLEEQISKERKELRRRKDEFRGNKPMTDIRNRTVILVDDGLATGYTALGAGMSIRSHHPRSLI